MYYRLVFGLLLIFILIAYIDTKSLRQSLDDAKILREYNQASKLIGIGLQDKNGEVRVQDVILNTPANKAGIETGDVLSDIDGEKIHSSEMVRNYLKNIKKNEKVALKIKKADNSIVEVTLTPIAINNFE